MDRSPAVHARGPRGVPLLDRRMYQRHEVRPRPARPRDSGNGCDSLEPYETEGGLALGFAHLLSATDARKAADSRETAVRDLVEAIKTERARASSDKGAGRTISSAMLDRQEALARAELAWIEGVRAQLGPDPPLRNGFVAANPHRSIKRTRESAEVSCQRASIGWRKKMGSGVCVLRPRQDHHLPVVLACALATPVSRRNGLAHRAPARRMRANRLHVGRRRREQDGSHEGGHAGSHEGGMGSIAGRASRAGRPRGSDRPTTSAQRRSDRTRSPSEQGPPGSNRLVLAGGDRSTARTTLREVEWGHRDAGRGRGRRSRHGRPRVLRVRRSESRGRWSRSPPAWASISRGPMHAATPITDLPMLQAVREPGRGEPRQRLAEDRRGARLAGSRDTRRPVRLRARIPSRGADTETFDRGGRRRGGGSRRARVGRVPVARLGPDEAWPDHRFALRVDPARCTAEGGL